MITLPTDDDLRPARASLTINNVDRMVIVSWVMVSAFARGEEPSWCANYIGLPFKSLGRDRAGIDCWGMVYLVYREVFHQEIPPYADYAEAYDVEKVGALVRGEIVTRWLEVSPAQLGDVILLRVRGQPCHVGVVVARGKFLHSFEGTHSCMERYDGLKWRRRIWDSIVMLIQLRRWTKQDSAGLERVYLIPECAFFETVYGWSDTQTSGANTDELSVDISFPGGLVAFNSLGAPIHFERTSRTP